MRGKTHWKIGICTYLLSSAAVTAFTYATSHTAKPLTLVAALPCIACAAIGSLFPDIDTENSKIGMFTAIIKKFSPFFLFLTLFILFSLAAFSIRDLINIVNNGDTSDAISDIIINLVFFAFSAILLVSVFFFLFSKKNKDLKTAIQRLAFIYIAVMVVLIGNFSIKMIFVAVSIAIIPYLKHRDFTHTVDGMIFYCLSFYFAAQRLGYPYLGFAFFIGYFSHIWLADFLTTQGIYISFTAKYLGEKSVAFQKSAIYNFLTSQKSLRLMSTDTNAGNLFELVYVIVLVALFLVILSIFDSVSIPFLEVAYPHYYFLNT